MTLVEQYKKMVFKYVNRIQAKHGGLLSLADLEASAVQGICEAEKSFNPSGGASLKTWIFIHARRQIQSEVKRQRKAMSENVTSSTHLDESDTCTNVVDTVGVDPDIEDRINREQLHDLLMSQIRRLPKKQQRVMIKLLARGMTQTELAQDEGVSTQQVHALYASAIQRLQGMMRRYRAEVIFA